MIVSSDKRRINKLSQSEHRNLRQVIRRFKFIRDRLQGLTSHHSVQRQRIRRVIDVIILRCEPQVFLSGLTVPYTQNLNMSLHAFQPHLSSISMDLHAFQPHLSSINMGLHAFQPHLSSIN